MPGGLRTPTQIGPYQGILESSATQKHIIGERILLSDGRVFYYCQAASANAPVKGKFASASTTINSEALITVAHAIGVDQVTLTAQATITANQFAEGYLAIASGTGAGDSYKIKGHPAIANAATGVITLYDPLRTAWSTTDTKAVLYNNPFSVVRISTTTATEQGLGVPLISPAVSEYFWLQTWGWAVVWMDGATGNSAIERALILSTNTAGKVLKSAASGNGIVGQMVLMAANAVDADYTMIKLTCMP